MIDLKYLQNHFEEASAKLHRKGVEEKLLQELKKRFETLKSANRRYEEARAEQNRLSKLFGQYKREGKEIGELQESVNRLKTEVAGYQEEAREAEEALAALAMGIPNFPDDDVPMGLDEEDNVEIRKVLEPRKFDFEPKEHWELAELNGWIDFERGVKLAKSRFAVLKGQGARIQTALINFSSNATSPRASKSTPSPLWSTPKCSKGPANFPNSKTISSKSATKTSGSSPPPKSR